jgi:tRNA(Glu) U13 pseudouridine synthase TruD
MPLSSSNISFSTTSTGSSHSNSHVEDLRTNEGDQSMSIHPVIQRHYSSIGIGDVFVQHNRERCVTTSHDDSSNDGSCREWLLPSLYFAPRLRGAGNSNHNFIETSAATPILGDEMIGTIKSTPEDFIVREIAVLHGQVQTADLQLSSKLAKQPTASAITTASNICDTIHHIPTKCPPNDDSKTATTPSCETKQSPSLGDVETCNATIEVLQKFTPCGSGCPKVENEISNLDHDFLQEFQSVLSNQFLKNTDLNPRDTPDDVLIALQGLEREALDTILSIAETCKISSNTSPLPISSPLSAGIQLTFCISCDKDQQKQDKTRIHQCIRNAFPLLIAENTIKDATMTAEAEYSDESSAYCIHVAIDTTFFELIPYLFAPVDDLPLLYKYAKYGFEHARDQSKKQSKAVTNGNSNGSSRGISRYNVGSPVLRLQPNLPRCNRRPFHQVIDTKSKSLLGTETINDYPLTLFNDPYERNDVMTTVTAIAGTTTTAVRISWTKMAARQSTKKRMREELMSTSDPIRKKIIASNFMLCVLRKRQREHLGMINTISAILKCPPSTIGFAGIKDLHSISYQFCTLNLFAAQRIHSTRSILQQRGIDIVPLHEIDHALNKGDLIGNHFEIILRNVRRIQLQHDKNSTTSIDSSIRESFIPVDTMHLRFMVKRVRLSGFINFFGEQRVGDPGHMSKGMMVLDQSVVGVRAFDIGKAMLQKNYSQAIDLLMAGRRIIHGVEMEGSDADLFRQIWKETNGDPIATMKALPSGGTSVPRERAVLKGLIRYGKDQPLTAFRCLHRNERLFFVNAVRIT